MKKKRSFAGSILGIVILAIGVVAFIVLPVISSGFGRDNLRTFGSWGDKKIQNTQDSDYFTKFSNIKDTYEAFGGKMPEESSQREYMVYQMQTTAMTAALVDLAMETEAEDAGYEPSKKLVNRTLINQYTDPSTGLYSQKLFNEKPEAAKIQIRKNVIRNLKRSRYISDVLGYGENKYGVKMSSKESEFIGKMNNTSRKFDYVIFDTPKYPQEKILEYGNEHKDLFTSYDFTIVSFQDAPAAKNVSSAIVKGDTKFEDAVSNQAKDVTNPSVDANGKLINSYRKDLNNLFPNAEDLDKVLSLKPGEVSTPIKMNSLYVILKCNAEPVEPDFSDKTLVNTVFYYMRQYEKGQIEDYLMEEAKKFIAVAKEKSFDEASKEYDVDILTSSAFGLNYGNSAFLPAIPYNTDPILAQGSRNQEFFEKTFGLKEGEISEPILISEQAVVCKVSEIESVEEDTKETKITSYIDNSQGWSNYYTIALVTRQYPVQLAQATVIDFFLEHPKTTNNLNNILR